MNLARLCERVARRFLARDIQRDPADPYLTRYYLRGGPRTDGQRVNLYLHKFHRGDQDQDLHNHPWAWSVSLILTGGYVEERREGNAIRTRVVRPGRINIIRANDFHRVDLLDPAEGAWTLFLAGPRVQRWGFWDRFSGAMRFVARKDGQRCVANGVSAGGAP